MKKRAIVIGGGLAGLVSAYELSRSKRFDVTLLEVESHTGGRAHTRSINNTPVDYGGFIIYPWYYTFRKYVKYLRLQGALHNLPSLKIFYDIHNTGEYINKLSHPYKDFSRWKFFRNVLLPGILYENPTYPNLNAFGRLTVHELLRSCQKDPSQLTDFEAFSDTVSQGYCYAPLSTYKAAFGIPVIIKSRLFGDVSRSSYLKLDGLKILTQALEKEIRANGGKIRTSAPVLDINTQTKEVILEQETLQADTIIFAQPFNNLTQKALNIPESTGPKHCSYTHFAVVTIRFKDAPHIGGTQQWGAAFYRRDSKKDIQVLSSINLEPLYGKSLKGYVNMNVVFNSPTQFPPKDDLLELLYDMGDLDQRFPNQEALEVTDVQYWPHTMPVAQESLVEQVRASQGKNGYFYAGDYLGCPSMETAVQTGRYAAKLAIKAAKRGK